MNEEISKSTSVEELQQYIQYLHACIPLLHKNQKTLFDFGEEMIEKHRKQKLGKDAILDMYVKERENNEDSVGLVKQLTLKCRKLKKEHEALKVESLLWRPFWGSLEEQKVLFERQKELLEEQNRLKDEMLDRATDRIEELKEENKKLKERLKHNVDWRERAKMEEEEEEN